MAVSIDQRNPFNWNDYPLEMGAIGTRVASAWSSWQNQKCFSMVGYSTFDFAIAKPGSTSATYTRSVVPSIHVDWPFHWAALRAKGF
jgi:hypothetical protein